jgi:tetratricopeptide (TPR) repeat protein
LVNCIVVRLIFIFHALLMPSVFLQQLWRVLLGGLLLTNYSVWAQHGHRYWDASPDSLQRVLTHQRADTAQLRTLRQLADLTEDERYLTQVVALTARLHLPDHRPYQLWLAGQRLHLPGARQDSAANASALDSLQLAVELFDKLNQPKAPLLAYLRLFFLDLHRPEARRAYYTRKLAYYQQRGQVENVAACFHALAGSYSRVGDYNRAISCLLRAADLARDFNTSFYYNELGSVATAYMKWGNYGKAQYYFRQALRQPGASWHNFLYCNLTTLYLRQQQYPAALQAVERALHAAADPTDPFGVYDRTYALVLKSEVLLALHQPRAAGQLLPLAQQLVDSLHIRLTNTHSDLELAATWARYYLAVHQPDRAVAAWQLAYRQAQRSRSLPLQLTYLRQLAHLYYQLGRSAPAAAAALATTSLADTLAAGQGRWHVAYYEQQQAAQRQT